MFSLRLYIQILLRVGGILLVGGLGVAGIVTGRAVILGVVAVGIALALIGSLVFFLNASNRRIRFFLDAIEDNESMFSFPQEYGSAEQRRLHTAFNRISRLVTEEKRRAFERELQQKEVESWDRLMRTLTHEIMNSIAPIVSLSGTLLSYFRKQEEATPPQAITRQLIGKTIRGLDTIRSQGEHLMHFTHSYRSLASLRRPEMKPFSLTLLLAHLHTLFQTDLDERRIAFSLSPACGEELQITADEEQLSQVLVNLLKNAMQALEGEAGGWIAVAAERLPRHIQIAVSDNGPGIARELTEEIFVPFFTTKSSGSGIGLSLSRQIVRMHGGELQVVSLPYVKTSFTVLLPLTPVKNDPAGERIPQVGG